MKLMILLTTTLLFQGPMELFDFRKGADLSGWQVVDDVVMGGRSEGGLYLNDEGHGVFEGDISLENFGGFSSVRHRFNGESMSEYSTFVIRLKGDSKRYQFRTKSNMYSRHSYAAYFETSGDWQEIKIPDFAIK